MDPAFGQCDNGDPCDFNFVVEGTLRVDNNLNNKLRHVNWNYILKHCDADTAWYNFKNKLFELCNAYIPTITIQSDFQPPWFDCDTYKLCKKRKNLGQNIKRVKILSIINNFLTVDANSKTLSKKK